MKMVKVIFFCFIFTFFEVEGQQTNVKGNLKIGNGNAIEALDVDGNIIGTGNLQLTSGYLNAHSIGIGGVPSTIFDVIGYYQSINIDNSGTSLNFAGPYNGVIKADQALHFMTDGWNYRMKICEDGKVGIGTIGPQYKLYVHGTNDAAITIDADQLSQQPGFLYEINQTRRASTFLDVGGVGSTLGRLRYGRYNINGGFLSSPMDVDLDTGNVGIGVGYPESILDVNGVVNLRDVYSEPDSTGGGASGIYSFEGHLYGVDHDHNNIVLTPHIDPRKIDPIAKTSFSDPNVTYPFSYYQKNILLGKEQIVDMAKLVAWAEEKMKSEKGVDAGRLIFTRDLPTSECMTYERFKEIQREHETKNVLEKLDKIPWIKMTIGADGMIPPEAFEEVPIFEEIEKKVKKTLNEINYETMRLETNEREVTVVEKVPTGKNKRQLRSGWKFQEGELYRQPTINDIDLTALIKDVPQLPQWIADRIKDGQKISMDLNVLATQIRQTLAANQDKKSEQQIKAAR